MSLEKTITHENTGIDLGKETVEVSRGRIQELVDGGMGTKEATAAAIQEITTQGDKESIEDKNTKEATIRADIDAEIEKKTGPIVGFVTLNGGEKSTESAEKIPGLKIEGETYTTDDGRAVIIESDKDGVCKARLISPTEDDIRDNKTTFDIPREKIEEKAIGRRDKMISEYANRFGFNKEDYLKLESNPEYQKLSHGEKKFVLESFSSATLEKIDESADEKFKGDMAKKGFFGRIGHSITKESKLSKARKETFEAIRGQKYGDQNKETLDAIISRAGAMGVPMIENEKGELEVQYSAQFADKLGSSPQALRAMRNFNQAATALQGIPPEWESEFATEGLFSQGQKEKAEKLREEYKATKDACLNHYQFDPAKDNYAELVKDAAIVDGKVNLNRMMNAHPDNERVLNSLNKSMGKQVFTGAIKDMFTKDYRLAYAGGGAAARLTTKYFNAFSYGLEGMMARKQVREDEKMLRRGAERTTIGEKTKENIGGKIVSVGKKSDMLRLENQ
ncbi:MAG: hypothetical protein RL641_450, partial [Candidatus Parcubacteria bacterium]